MSPPGPVADAAGAFQPRGEAAPYGVSAPLSWGTGPAVSGLTEAGRVPRADSSLCFFARYVNAFDFVSLERIKTFEELSLGAASVLHVSSGSCRSGPPTPPTRTPAVSAWPSAGAGHSGSWNGSARGADDRT